MSLYNEQLITLNVVFYKGIKESSRIFFEMYMVKSFTWLQYERSITGKVYFQSLVFHNKQAQC